MKNTMVLQYGWKLFTTRGALYYEWGLFLKGEEQFFMKEEHFFYESGGAVFMKEEEQFVYERGGAVFFISIYCCHFVRFISMTLSSFYDNFT